MNDKQTLLYSALIRHGDLYQLNYKSDVNKFLNNLQTYENNWGRYNPRTPIERYGLSITSLDGKLDGIPDLDSLYQYNKIHKTKFTELDFIKKTPIYDFTVDWLDDFSDCLCRSHVIKLSTGGFFPMHRDLNGIDIDSFRLFIPIINCNPPQTHFILNSNILNFEHGRLYFFNACAEHVIFNASHVKEAIFIVANIALNEDSVLKVLSKKTIM